MYETYSRSRIHEAYPQLRAHAFKHWDRIFGSRSHSTDRRPLVLYVSVDLFSELKTRRRGFALAYRGGSRHSFITKS